MKPFCRARDTFLAGYFQKITQNSNFHRNASKHTISNHVILCKNNMV